MPTTTRTAARSADARSDARPSGRPPIRPAPARAMTPSHPERGQSAVRGRGAVTNPVPRFDAWSRDADSHRRRDDIGRPFDDADAVDAAGDIEIDADADELPRLATVVTLETARTIIARNTSPDIPFDRSVNPYRGCEHGCTYCYARPTHTYLDLSPGLDFETRLYAKTNTVEKLREAFDQPGYRAEVLALGANTDPYQPIEKTHRLTRGILELAEAYRHPISITTKSALVLRDADILARMAQQGLVRVYLSVATLDATIARQLEPRATTPVKRLEAVRELRALGIPCGVMVAPVIPALTDFDVEHVLREAARAGAGQAGYVMLRLPLEVRDIFEAWLETYYPDRRRHVMHLVEQMRDGKHNDSEFGRRMRGTGLFAELLAQRFRVACERHGLNGHNGDQGQRQPLRTDLFADSPARQAGLAARAQKQIIMRLDRTRAVAASPQLDLFT